MSSFTPQNICIKHTKSFSLQPMWFFRCLQCHFNVSIYELRIHCVWTLNSFLCIINRRDIWNACIQLWPDRCVQFSSDWTARRAGLRILDAPMHLTLPRNWAPYFIIIATITIIIITTTIYVVFDAGWKWFHRQTRARLDDEVQWGGGVRKWNRGIVRIMIMMMT